MRWKVFTWIWKLVASSSPQEMVPRMEETVWLLLDTGILVIVLAFGPMVSSLLPAPIILGGPGNVEVDYNGGTIIFP